MEKTRFKKKNKKGCLLAWLDVVRFEMARLDVARLGMARLRLHCIKACFENPTKESLVLFGLAFAQLGLNARFERLETPRGLAWF